MQHLRVFEPEQIDGLANDVEVRNAADIRRVVTERRRARFAAKAQQIFRREVMISVMLEPTR
jgi:hypothetical protein